jgi:photosystem II PsbY protein
MIFQVNDLARAAAVLSMASPLLFTESADAATEAMTLAAGDVRAGLLAFPLLAALGWVGFNIAGPALNQINDMGEKKKGLVAGTGLGLATLLAAQNADAATEAMTLAAGDVRAGLLAFPLLAALGWVGFNIAGPALNQINDMGEKRN